MFSWFQGIVRTMSNLVAEGNEDSWQELQVCLATYLIYLFQNYCTTPYNDIINEASHLLIRTSMTPAIRWIELL